MISRTDDELDHYATVFNKISDKKYELYVISRIVHCLDDRQIEFTTQQHIKTKKGRFLLDLYFPQVKIAVEVDEAHHERQPLKDSEREAAVINESEVEKFLRVDVAGKSIDDVHSSIKKVVQEVQRKKAELKKKAKFSPYVYGRKYDIDYWLKKGKIATSDDARFRTHADVAKLFGRNYERYQKATIKLDDGNYIWFPKLYENKDWDNQVSPDGKEIVQKRESGSKIKKKGRVWNRNMIVFAHYRDELGKVYYTFKGVYRTNPPQKDKTTFSLISDAISFNGKGSCKFIEIRR